MRTTARSRLIAARAGALACALLFALPAVAQPEPPPGPSLNVQRFTPAANFHDFVLVDSARLLPARAIAVDIMFSYAHRPLQVTTGTGAYDVSMVEGLTSGHFRAGFGLADWLELDLQVPIMQLSQVGIIDGVGGNRVHFSLGDARISGKFLLHKNDAGAAIGAIPFVTFPTGRRALHLTLGVPSFGARFAFTTWMKRLRAGAHIGYRLVPGSAVVGTIAVDDELLYGAAVGVSVIRDLLDINLELSGVAIVGPARWRLPSTPFKFGVHSPLEANINLRLGAPSGLDVSVGVGAGLSPGAGTPAVRAFLGIGWAPPTGPPDDPDRDLILTKDDECPRVAEDRDGFEDDDGCPDLDNDLDGVADRSDACPGEAEDRDGYKDNDGCPDPDNDGDGVADELDECPNDAEDLDGSFDEDGCPDDDGDGDGVADAADLCPQAAEDLDGFEDGDGCPEDDNDGDGILDVDDICPLQPEEFNGVDDADGCPDSVQAIVRGKKIVILKKILFVSDRADIVQESYDILEAVRDALNDNPNIELVRVEGYSDSRGDVQHNFELSEARARAVMSHLIGAGVDPGRLEAVGFGEANPIADNETETGRQANRRVEFAIIRTTDDDLIMVPGSEDIQIIDGNAPPAGDEEAPAPEG